MSWQNDPIAPPSPGRPETPWERDALVGPTTRQTLTTAVTMKAESVAEAERLAKRYPAPPEVIMQDLEAYRLQEAIDLADTDLQKAPMLREILRRDVRKAALAQDDIPVLSRVAQAARDVANIGKAGVFGASRGVAGTARAGLELVAPVLDVLEPLDPNATSPGLIPRVAFPGGNPLRRLAEGFGMQAEAAGRTAEVAMPRYESTLGQGVASGLRSLTQNLMTLPMAFLPGGQGAALAGMTTFTGGDAYQQAREKGIPMSQALPFAASQAAVEYATEKLPLARLIGDVRAGTPFFQTLLRQIALEVPGEQVATLLQDLNEWAVINPDKPFSSYLEERPSAAAQTLIATIVGTGGNVAVVKGIERMVERATREGTNMQRAGLAAQALEQAMRGAEASRMRELSPEQFRDVMTQMAEDGSLYVDGRVLNQLPPEVLNQLPESVREKVATAAAIGDSVEIPVADVLTIAPGTPLEQVFLQNARTAPDAPSLVEAEAAGQKAQEFLQQEAARVISQAQDQEALRQSQETVKQNIRQQLAATGRFRDAVNEGYATWAAAFYTAYGSRLGLTPEQFYQRYPLRVLGAAQGQQTGVLNAGERSVVNNMTAAQIQAEITDLMPRVQQAYEAGNAPLAERLDARLETLMDALDANLAELEEDTLTPADLLNPMLAAKIQDGEQGDAEADVVRDLANRWRDMQARQGDSPAEQAAEIKAVLDDYAFRHGGLREGLSDTEVLDAARDAYDAVYGRQERQRERMRAQAGGVLNQSVTTMVPTTKGAVVDPALVKVPGIAEAEADDPKAKAALEANVGLFDKKVQVIADKEKRGYDSMKPTGDTPKARAESIIDQMVRNLLTIYDAIPAAIRNRSRLWYDGANRISLAFAQRYNMTPMQSAAQLAVLSPQADWFMNVSYAERINDILDFRQDHAWDAEMDAWATEWIANSEESRQKESERRAEAVREAQRALVEAERAKARADAALEKNTPKLTEKITSAEEALKAAEQAVKDAKKTGTPAALKRAEAQRDKRNEVAKAARQALRDAKGAVSKAETAIRQASRKLQEKTDYAAEPDPNLAVQPNIRGKKLSELQTDFERAWWVRAYDEAHHPRAYRVVTPEGGFLDFAKLDDGVSNDSIAWKSFSPIAKAISIRRDGSLANVHAMLGGEHKVRNFYNNIYAPNAPFPFVTSDTHQVAANLFLPLGADALEVGQNFGGTGTKSVSEIGLNGTYWLYSEAVAKAAKQRGVLPREMQSISWEAIRSLFSPTFKANSDSVNAVRDLWVRHHAGEASYEDTIAAIIRLAGGRYRDPSWVGVRPDSAAAPEAGNASYESQLAHARQGLAERGEPGRGDAGVPGSALPQGDVLEQGARGTFNPQTLELVLNPNADLSTWFHETGHFFLEVLADVASQPDAPAQIVEDYNKVLAWFGVTPEQWAGFTLDQKRPYHERWAESIEQYVLEGKAPSVELQPVMRRFAAWLKSVYQSIKQFLAQRGVPVAGGQDLAQPAFHGTPQRDITQFSTEFIGTGEGFQAFGWGLYFTNKRDIAEFYREKLTGGDLFAPFEKDGRVIDTGVDLAEAYYRTGKIVRGYGGADKVLEFRRTDNGGWAVKVVGVRANGEPMSSERPRWHSTFPSRTDLKLDLEADGWTARPPGQLYEVDIPEDEDLLVWDKPLGQQPEKVRKALKDSGLAKELKDNLSDFSSPRDTRGKLNGENIYAYLKWKLGSDRAASERLRELGILGTNYPAGTIAGNTSARARNYVVFSGDDVAIRNQFYQGGEQQPLNIQLNDDIRRVMDRMLATDEQIAQANEVAGLMPDEQADAEAAERLQKRSMADLKWAVKARDKVIAKLKRQAREIEKAIREQVTVEVDQMPEMRAKAKLDELRKTSPEYKAALKAWQTQRQAAKDAAAQSIRDNLLATEGAGLKGLDKGQFLARKKREIENQAEAAALAWEAQNAKPERPLAASDLEVAAIADSFGYESVEQMLQAIDAFGKRADAIDGLTEQRMLEEHGDLVDERAIQEAANEAVHNEARARSLATELRTQREMLGGRTDTGQTNARGARVTVNTLVEAAKQFGANVIARTPLKDLRSTAWKHTAAERRAGKRWAEATAAGDTQAAVQAKQDQVLNNAAAKAALDAATEAKKILEFFRRVTKGNDEKTVEKGRDPDIVNAARAVLAAYGIETPTTKGAAAYLEAVKTNDPDTYAAIEPMIAAATQNAQPLEALTFEELQGLAESIQAMWHLAKRSRQMEVDGDLMDIDDVAGELFVRLEEIGIPDRVPGEGMAVTREEERGLFVKQGIAFLRRVEQWAEGMDGKYGGPFLRFVFQPIKDAADRYRAERITYRKKFQALVDNLAPIVGDSVIDAPELGYKFGTPGSTAGTAMNEILHAIAHTGNESNKRKLLLGRGWAAENPDGTLDTSRWDAFIRRLVNEGKLERAHFDFVQGVWDLLEETKPLAQKAHRDAFGRYFSEVTADAFVDPFGVTRRGGYVPAQVDSRLVKDNVLRKMAEEENNSMAYAFPQPAKGFTMGRTEYNRPLMLDLRSLSQHLDKVLLFSHMTNPARDVRKLLTRKTVSQPLDRIQPAAIESMLQPWLQRSAQQIVETPIVGSGKWARLPGLIRARAGMALMFANVSNAIQQVTGLAGAAVRVKPSMLMRAVAQYVANPVQFSRAVWDASPYMDDRAKNEVAVMNEQMQAILLKPSTYEKVQDWSMRHAYFLQTALDNVLSPIVWTGAFNQALAEGMSDADAVRFADSTVRQTQGSTLPEDVSRVETGPAYARAFTQFVGYFNMMANTNGTALKQIANEVGLKKGAGKALYVVLMGLMVPIWVAEAIALAFKGGPEDEDDDGYLDDWLASVFGMGTAKGMLAQIPILGQFAVAGMQRFNDNPLDDRVSLSPAISLLESSVGAPQSVYKAIVEDGSAQKAIRDVATLVSVATGVPVYGLARPVGYAAGVAQGKIEPTSAADAARGVVTGTASPESKQR